MVKLLGRLLPALLAFYGLGPMAMAQAPLATNTPACEISAELERLSLRGCSEDSVAPPLLKPFTANATPHRLLIRLQVRGSAGADTVNGLLSLGVPDAFELRGWLIDAAGHRQALPELDEQSHYRDRPVASPRLYLPLALPPGAQAIELHYRIQGQGRLQPQWLSRAAMEADGTADDVINGAITGIMLTLFGVVMVYRYVGGSSAYIAYAALLLSELLILVQAEGYGFAFFWPDAPRWNAAAPPAFTTLVMAFHALFAVTFLQLRQRYPRLYRAHQLGLVLLALNLLQWGHESMAGALVLWTLAYSALALSTGWRAALDRVPGAPLYLLGASALIVFGFLLFLLGVIGLNPFPAINFFHYPKFALLLEAGFFSAALINRVRQHQEQLAEARVRRLAETEELLRAEAERRAALEQAQQQSLQLASASHDISQPLASLRFAITALKASSAPGGAAQPIALHLDRTLSYAETLLKDIISETRDTLPAQPERVPLGALFEQLAAEHRAQAEARGLRLRVARCGASVDGSALILARILNNLLSNALRYTPSHGGRGQVLLGARRRAGGIELQVLDTGPGLLPTQLQTLMQPFRQGEQAASQGFGLGLFIVKSLCEQGGFRFSVRSELNRGSCFAVFIPSNSPVVN
ncbi:sensor histidine kinase [Paucibacter sp. APW11]|uniref:histidine kinase n=1 Tax=Roseateles aquae TaxID=3077235 RepID=A0ABU3P823_9BURK|nr:sensor histidine kinase [Paucibacter sp. APW11]MDT8997901.1 sensor histidine kinase [Paucibacter sp. APW11]